MANKKKRRKIKRTKEQSQNIHARRRFQERFGIFLTKELKAEILQTIHKGFASFVEKQSNRISLFDVTIKGSTIRVVYDKVRKNIVSALWPEGVDGDGKRVSDSLVNTNGEENELETRVQVDN